MNNRWGKIGWGSSDCFFVWGRKKKLENGSEENGDSEDESEWEISGERREE